MKAKTRKFFQSLNMNVFNGYGLSETAAAVTMHEGNAAHTDKPGKPLPGTDIRIFNPDE